MTAAPRRSSWDTLTTKTMVDDVCAVLGLRVSDLRWKSRSMSEQAIRTRTRTVLAAIILNRMGYGTPEIAELFGRESHTTVRDMVLKDPKTPSIDRLVSMMWTLIREGWMHGAEQAVEAAEFDIHRKGK